MTQDTHKHHRKWRYQRYRIEERLKKGMNVKQIAGELQLTERSVYRYIEELRTERESAE